MNLFNEHEEYMKPYFEGGRIIAESFLPLYKKGESGELAISMMNTIAKIVEVRRADRSETYTEGKDYRLRDGKLLIPEGSGIKIMRWEEYCLPEGGDDVFECVHGDGNLLFYNRNEFHTMQYEITYDSADNIFDGKYVPTAAPELSGARKKLAVGEKLKLAFYGDSITFGYNASGLCEGVAPYMPVYPKLLCETLEKRGKKIHYCNPSIGGISTFQGIEMADRTLGRFVPDVTVIAFGMNDACISRFGKEELIEKYTENIKGIMDAVRKVNPHAEFILVSTTLANPIAKRFNRLQADFEAPLGELAKKEGAAFLNITDLHRTLMTRKEYHHMTGNNINHPSDYLSRLYAQGVMALLGE